MADRDGLRAMTANLVALAILGLGVAFGLVVTRHARLLAIPIALLLGVVLGDRGAGWLPADGLAGDAADLGLLLMLFYTSLFGSPRAVRQGIGLGLPLAAYDLVLNFAVAWWIGGWFGIPGEERLVLAGILATSSTAVVLKVLADERRFNRREGNVLLSLLLVEDWVFLAYFAILSIRAGHLPHRTVPDLMIGIGLFVGFLLILRFSRRLIWDLTNKETLIVLLTAIGILGGYLGTLAGLPGLGGAFTTGLMLASGRAADFVGHQAPYLRDAAAALFFTAYGAILGPTLDFSVLPMLGAAILGVAAVELLFIPVLARRLGLSRMEGFLAGASLIGRGGKTAAFGNMAPGATAPLFPLAGLLTLVLTPLTPAIVRIALRVGRGHRRSLITSGGETFSHSARGFLMPHQFRQRGDIGPWDKVVLVELLLLAALSSAWYLLSPEPWRWGGLLAVAAIAPFYFLILRRLAENSPNAPRRTHPLHRPLHANPGTGRIPLLLTAPLVLIVVFAATAPWSHVAYPIVLASTLLVAAALPWMRPARRGAPALERALSRSSRATLSATTATASHPGRDAPRRGPPVRPGPFSTAVAPSLRLEKRRPASAA